jgi:hypothetical protein
MAGRRIAGLRIRSPETFGEMLKAARSGVEDLTGAKVGDKTMMVTSIDSNAGGDLPNKKIDFADAQHGGVAPRYRE